MANHETIVIVDLGLGNLHSVEKAVAEAARRSGLSSPEVTRDPDRIARASRVIVPGQGAFRDGAAALDRDGGAMRTVLRDTIARGRPYLGICLGLQLLLDESEEAPGARGLSVIPGRVVRIPDGLQATEPNGRTRTLKVPHMGWNEVHAVQPSPFAQKTHGGWFYFVHSYHAMPEDPARVAATATYGCLEITAAVERGTLVATQFHPEKSQAAGLALLEAFLLGPL